MATALENLSSLLVLLDQNPIVVTEKLFSGDAVLVAERKFHNFFLDHFAFREGVSAKQLLSWNFTQRIDLRDELLE
jgi:hypothetical protein